MPGGSLEKETATKATTGILLTGFGPFKDVSENPSSVLARQSDLPYVILEVSFKAVDDWLANLDAASFNVLLMMGVAGGRDRLTPEFYGRNFVGNTPDVTGEVRFGAIDDKGPLLLPSTLWKAEAVAEWTLEYPIRASFDAGEYLCNYISYRALEKFPTKEVGFLHVPEPEKLALDEQAKVLSMILESIT